MSCQVCCRSRSTPRRSPAPQLPDTEIAQRVQLRMARQTILTRDDAPPEVRCVLDEAVLRRMVGGREVMRRQLEHLVEMAQLLDVDLYLLPDSIGAHAGVEGTFTVLDYPEDFAPDPGTAYVEDRLQGHYDERPTEVADYRDAHKRLRTQALDPQPTVEAISRVAKDM